MILYVPYPSLTASVRALPTPLLRRQCTDLLTAIDVPRLAPPPWTTPALILFYNTAQEEYRRRNANSRLAPLPLPPAISMPVFSPHYHAHHRAILKGIVTDSPKSYHVKVSPMSVAVSRAR